MVLKTPSIYEFGPFRLEPAEHRLLRDGQQVSLAPKAFELLVYLVGNHGRLVVKDQIMRAVWSGSFVEEANLTVAVSALRKALGKTESGLHYIETVPKKGYRFTASVKEVGPSEIIELSSGEELSRASSILRFEPHGVSSAAAAQPLRLSEEDGRESPYPGSATGPVLVLPHRVRPEAPRLPIALAAVVLTICVLSVAGYFLYRRRVAPVHTPPVQRSLAILPLRNLRQDPNNDFLGFSLADAVITKLGSVNSLTVRPSSAVEKYRGKVIDPPKVAAELNVDTLLTGSFIREGDELRITYQLIDAKTDRILDRDTIDLKFERLLTVQDNVARQIIKGLELNLSPAEAERIKPDEPVNPLAYEYYLRGVDLMGRHDFLLAVNMLERSAGIDPNHALTWAYLGQSYTSAASFDFGGREQYRKAEAAYERALALKPKQLEASMFLANLLIDTGKVERAVPLLREAINTSPQHAALHWELGYAYRFAGMLKESVAECERARQIDPSVKANGSVLNTYLYLGQYDKFLESLPDVNESAFVLFYRGFGEFHRRNWDRAAKDFERSYQLDPSLYAQIGVALSHSIARKNSEGLEILNKVETKIEQRGVGDPEATYKIAQAYAVLGDKNSALRTFRYSIQNGFFSYPYFLKDPLLDSVRPDPQFARLMNSARQRHEAFKTQFF
ncbi:MAG TPA: winged helix-turn-helix domain-containing protein [Bryobacteraceae bacterium]|jgi:DNA-binding winged helix-turn-helix (wHTH) protein/TolB-like protein/Tfp pilus assembly protein PilF